MQAVARAAKAPTDAGFVDWLTKLGGTRSDDWPSNGREKSSSRARLT